MLKTPGKELDNRVKRLQSRLETEGMDGALIVQNVDLLYFSGTIQQACIFIPASGAPLLFVRKNPERVKRESNLENIIPIKGIRDLPKLMADFGYNNIKRLGMELDVLPANHYFRYLSIFKPAEIVDVWPSIQPVRTIKSDYEIELINKAAALSDFIIQTSRHLIREGMSEIELSAQIEDLARKQGHQGLIRMRGFNQEVYWGHLVAGPEAADPSFIDSPTGGHGLSTAFPTGASFRRIRSNEPVIIDLCAGLNGYMADQTRTLAFGKLPERLEKAYHVSMEIEETLEDMIKPGITADSLFLEAVKIADSYGLKDHFMGYKDQQAGFCGHGVGLELDELPIIMNKNKMVLEPGMVFALEPKFSFPGAGIVGIEDTFVITKGGNEKMTWANYDVVISDPY